MQKNGIKNSNVEIIVNFNRLSVHVCQSELVEDDLNQNNYESIN